MKTHIIYKGKAKDCQKYLELLECRFYGYKLEDVIKIINNHKEERHGNTK
jgi:hypothetical protein